MRKEIERLGPYLLRSPDKIGSLLRLGYAIKLSSAKGFRRKEFASSLTSLSAGWEKYHHAHSVHQRPD